MSFENIIEADLLRLLVGEEIGAGIGRKVYALRHNPDLVIKCEETARSFQNVMEWETWAAVQWTAHARWFAPCVAISPCGIWLIQKRTQPVPAHLYPDRVPGFFTDLKHENWGMLDRRIVCHDYGRHLLMEGGMSKRLRKANWNGG